MKHTELRLSTHDFIMAAIFIALSALLAYGQDVIHITALAAFCCIFSIATGFVGLLFLLMVATTLVDEY